jgi:hypothetical protein
MRHENRAKFTLNPEEIWSIWPHNIIVMAVSDPCFFYRMTQLIELAHLSSDNPLFIPGFYGRKFPDDSFCEGLRQLGIDKPPLSPGVLCGTLD